MFLFGCLSLQAQNRPTPLENVVLKTDANVNNQKLTNVNSIIFYDTGTNLIVNLSTFMNLFEGISKKLVNKDFVSQYLIVSNGHPYMVTSNSTREVTLQGDTSFIRQMEPVANVTNMNVYGELIIAQTSTIDNSNYSLTQQDLTNGALNKLVVKDLFLSGQHFTALGSQNFSFTNTVTALDVLPVIKNAITLQSQKFCFHEWSFYVSNEGKFKMGKIYFATVNTNSARIIGDVSVEILGVDSSMVNYQPTIIVTNNLIKVSMNGIGYWNFWGFSKEQGF